MSKSNIMRTYLTNNKNNMILYLITNKNYKNKNQQWKKKTLLC